MIESIVLLADRSLYWAKIVSCDNLVMSTYQYATPSHTHTHTHTHTHRGREH